VANDWPMLARLQICQFRVYRELDLDLQPGLTVLFGDNGQGKTALLEAIYCLATSRSFRTTQERDLVLHGQTLAWVRATLKVDKNSWKQSAWSGGDGNPEQQELFNPPERESVGDHHLALSWDVRRSKVEKQLAYRDRPVQRLSEFLGALPAALFTPEDLNLVCGGPSERRRYLDLLLCKTDPSAVECLGRFQRLLASRNKLIRRFPIPTRAEFEVFEMLLAEEAARLVRLRLEALIEIQPLLQEFHAQLAGDASILSLGYRVRGFSKEKPDEQSPSPTKEQYLERYEGQREHEIQRGQTLFGPHRDELDITFQGSPLRQFGSQGQCRTVALALRLAQAAYFQKHLRQPTVLLLDDCLSELDPSRQQRLLDQLTKFPQVLVTTASPIAIQADQTWIRVRSGEVLSC
jgi:DNA replication and repair protein RecF